MASKKVEFFYIVDDRILNNNIKEPTSIMRSMFSLEEVGEMLDMDTSEVKKEIENGHLTYSFHDGEKQITLYDLEKYMGAEQTQKITRDYLSNKDTN